MLSAIKNNRAKSRVFFEIIELSGFAELKFCGQCPRCAKTTMKSTIYFADKSAPKGVRPLSAKRTRTLQAFSGDLKATWLN